jgi:oxygen-dependent protoporphyrinogen oxidase
MSKKIAVIGAGIAGLTAAYFLKKSGHDVTVFEASERVGGRMTSDIIEDCVIDRGAQFLMESYSTLIPLIKEVGLESKLIESTSCTSMVKNKKIKKLSLNQLLSPLLSGYLSPLQMGRLIGAMLIHRKKILQMPLNDASAWANVDNEWAHDFIKREFGAGLLESLFEPQLQGFYYQTPEETSKVIPMMLMNFALKKGKVLSLEGGMGTLPLHLASGLNVKLNHPITSLVTALEQNGETVSFDSPSGRFTFDQVVLATTATVARTLFRNPNEIEKALLATQYSSTINMGFASNASWSVPKSFEKVYGVLISRKERQWISSIGIESRKDPARSKQGELLDIMLDGFSGSKLASYSEGEILKEITPEIEMYFPHFTENIRLKHFVRWVEAEPKSPMGKFVKIKQYRESIRSNSPIILCGDYMGFPNTDGAAATGKWAAEVINSF